MILRSATIDNALQWIGTALAVPSVVSRRRREDRESVSDCDVNPNVIDDVSDMLENMMNAAKIKSSETYVIVGSGDPPTLLHVNSCFLSSVATTTLPGATSGGCGGVRTVTL